jgi:NADPH:quinone reductase-like Zn-dependent oxidoreductase
MTHATTDLLRRLGQLLDSKAIRTRIDTVFPLESGKEAFQRVEQGHGRGKVVFQVKPG